MRKIQDYIVKDKEIFIGLEDSKKTWYLCVRSQGMVIHEISMPVSYANLRNYIFKRYPGCRVTVIYEAGFNGFWLHDLLTEDGIECIVTPPNKVTEEKSNKVKTDRIDAKRLSKILENNDYKRCFVPDKERREDRQISRTLIAVQKDIRRTKCRIRMFFHFHGLNKMIEKWTETTYQQLRSLTLGSSLELSLKIMVDHLDFLKDYRKRLNESLKELSKKERYTATFNHFKSAPGIGWLSAIRFVLEWGADFSRFKRAKSFSGYLGVIPGEFSTGDKIRRGHITTQSNNFVRAWLIQCSWTAIRKDPVLLQKFQNVRNNSGSKKKAIVAVARKLSARLWHMAVYDEDYVLGLVESQPVEA